MVGSIFNDLQKFINDLRKLVLFFTQALYAASTLARTAVRKFRQSSHPDADAG